MRDSLKLHRQLAALVDWNVGAGQENTADREKIMASTMWIAIAAIAICGIIGGVISDIVKSGRSKVGTAVQDLEDQVQDLEADLVDARKRIEVLEKIVTDGKYDLGRQIDDLAS